MTCTQPRYFTALSISLILYSLATVGLPAQALPSGSSLAPIKLSLNFKVPNRGAPPTTAGGASRGSCAAGNKDITPLVPRDRLGLTVAAHPSFFFYVPESSAKSVELLLLTEDDTEVVYQTTFVLPRTSGVVRLDLPQTAPTLQVGKRYHWYLTVNCDPSKGPSGNPSVEGWVERTEPELALAKALAKADPNTRPELYAGAGIWHETLATLIDLRRTNPTNLKVLNDWKELLHSVGLDSVATEPVIDCCVSSN